MRCSSCGFDNDDKDKYCGNCGATLKKDNNSYAGDLDVYQNIKNKKSLDNKKIILSVVLVLFLISVGGFIYTHNKKKTEIRNLESQLEIESIDKNYRKMIEINQSLYAMTNEEKYKDEIVRINLIKENEDKINKAEKYIENEEFLMAYKIIYELKQNDSPNSEEINALDSQFYSKLKSRLLNNNKVQDYQSSIEILEDLINIDSKNEQFMNLLESTKNKSDSYNKKVVAQNKTRKLNNTGDKLLYKTLHVTAKTAHIRSGPGLNYPILFTIFKGDTIYVRDYSVDNSGIIWLDCYDGWVSYNNFNGKVKN